MMGNIWSSQEQELIQTYFKTALRAGVLFENICNEEKTILINIDLQLERLHNKKD